MNVQMKALKLDATYRPIEIIDAVEALFMCLIGKAKPIETYEKKIASPSKSFELPAVIVLKTIVKFRFAGVACNRANIFIRDKNICQYCTKSFPTDQLTLDHMLPKSRGGLNTWTNLVTSCKKCNQKKGCRTPEEASMLPLTIPKRPKSNILRCITKNQISELWNIYLWNNS